MSARSQISSNMLRWLKAALLPLLLVTASCGLPPPARSISCAAAPAPEISRSADGLTERTTLSVLTYNIEGLAWPARQGRGPALREIGERLAAMRAAGAAPDIVMFQEMFSDAAKRAVADAGYPAIAPGPDRRTRSGDSVDDPLPGSRNVRRGEIGLRLLGGGLAITSRYPITHSERRAYGRRSCAGIDCLSNKGVMLARIVIPGVPTPIDLYNTHMNSGRASRVAEERHLAAHERQALEASWFIERTHDDRFPLVFGGDFNMRHSEDRWDNFSRYQSLELVHRLCADPDSGCDVRMSWDGDEPWMDTQDLQFFWSGEAVTMRPIRVETMFDGGPSGPQLSDHDGFLVTYELSWPVSVAGRNHCAAN